MKIEIRLKDGTSLYTQEPKENFDLIREELNGEYYAFHSVTVIRPWVAIGSIENFFILRREDIKHLRIYEDEQAEEETDYEDTGVPTFCGICTSKHLIGVVGGNEVIRQCKTCGADWTDQRGTWLRYDYEKEEEDE